MRKRRRRRRRIAAFFITVLIFILIGVIIAGLIYFARTHKKNKLAGTWEYRVDYSDYVTFSVNDWIGEKNSEKVTFTPVSVLLTLGDDDTYTVAIDETSYKKCEQEVRVYLEDRFAGLVSNELILSGYMGTEDVSATSHSLVNETIGGSLYEYLSEYGISFMSPYENISVYCTQGTYKYDKKKGTIEFTDAEGTKVKEKISIADDVIVLTGSDDIVLNVNSGISVQSGTDSTNNAKSNLYPITFKKR